jgi:hypothetical protein
MNVGITLVIMEFVGTLMEDIHALASKDGQGFTVILVCHCIIYTNASECFYHSVSFS